jgi:hypothetical protein
MDSSPFILGLQISAELQKAMADFEVATLSRQMQRSPEPEENQNN